MGGNETFRLYRFSPIQNQESLFEAIRHTHFECYKLCKQSFGYYLPNAGNIGIFCHYDEEYDRLIEIRKTLTEVSNNVNQKYFLLHQPLVIPAHGDVPETVYTHLYIRMPDPYRFHVGDVDFHLEQEKYDEQKASLSEGKKILDLHSHPLTPPEHKRIISVHVFMHALNWSNLK